MQRTVSSLGHQRLPLLQAHVEGNSGARMWGARQQDNSRLHKCDARPSGPQLVCVVGLLLWSPQAPSLLVSKSPGGPSGGGQDASPFG